jgi:hypothetical protein
MQTCIQFNVAETAIYGGSRQIVLLLLPPGKPARFRLVAFAMQFNRLELS